MATPAASNWGSAHFYPRVPQFAAEPPRKPDWQIFWIVEHGVKYSGMGGWSELMPQAEAWKVASFLSHLDSLPAVAAEVEAPAVTSYPVPSVDPVNRKLVVAYTDIIDGRAQILLTRRL